MHALKGIAAAMLVLSGCGSGVDVSSDGEGIGAAEKAKPSNVPPANVPPANVPPANVPPSNVPSKNKNTVLTVTDLAGNTANTYVFWGGGALPGTSSPITLQAVIETKGKKPTEPIVWTGGSSPGGAPVIAVTPSAGSAVEAYGSRPGSQLITATEPFSGASGSISVTSYAAYGGIEEVPDREAGLPRWGDPISLMVRMRVDGALPAGIPGTLKLSTGEYIEPLLFILDRVPVCTFSDVAGDALNDGSSRTIYERRCDIPSLNYIDRFYGPTVIRSIRFQTELVLENGAATNPHFGVASVEVRGLDCLDATQTVCDPDTGGPVP